MAGKSASILVKILGDESSLARSLGAAETKLGTFSSKMDALGGKLRSTGTTLTAGLTLPIVGMGVLAAKSFGEYERNLSVLQTTTGATTEQMERMRSTAKELGGDIRLPGTSAGDAAAAMLELAKGGLSVEESMDGARGVLELSAAAQIENAEAATIVADALNTFSLAGEDASRVSDLLAATANASTAEITDVAAGFQQAGAVFASNSVSIEDLSASLGLMANAGIKGSDAGTSLKSMMMRLTAPTDQASRAMDDLGLKIYDANGQMKPWGDVIGQLQQKTAGLSQEQRNMAYETIFGSDAIRAATVLTEAGTEGFDKMSGAVTKAGAAGDLAAAQNRGLLGAWDALISVVETLGVTLGEAFGPAITDALKTVGEWVGRLGEWFEKLGEPAKRLIGIGILIAAALGPVIWIAGAIASAIGLIVSPIGLVVAAVAGLVAAFVYFYNTNAGFREWVQGVVTAVREKLGQAFEWFRTTVLPALGQAFAWISENVFPAVGRAIDALRPLLADVGAFISQFVRTNIDLFTWLADHVDEAVRGIAAVFEWLRPVITAVWSAISAQVTAAITFVRGVIRTVTALLRGDWAGVWNGIKMILSGVWQGIVGIVSGAIGLVRGILTVALGAIRSVFSGAWNAVRSATASAFGAVTGAISGAMSSARSAVGSALGAIGGLFAGVRGTIARALSGLADVVSAPFRAAGNAIKSAWNSTIGGKGFTIPDIPGLPGRGTRVQIPRLHQGGTFWSGAAAGEGLALLRDGETVRTPEQEAALGRGPIIHLELNFHGPVARDSERWIVEQIETAVAKGVQLPRLKRSLAS